MRQRVADAQPRMDGGLNSISSDSVLADNQLRQARNSRLTEFGAITKRGGTQYVSDSLATIFGGGGGSPVFSAYEILNGFEWRKDDGTRQIMVVANATLYTTSYSSLPWTWTAQTGALSGSVIPYFAKFRDASNNDVVYIGDGGGVNRWDGTTLTLNISPVGAKNVVVHNQRLWSCGCGSNPQSIFYSSLNNGDTLGDGSSGGGEIIVRTFGDETIIGLASVNTSLLIFHRRGISRLTGYGQSDITVTPEGVSSDVGTISAGSIVPVENIAYFVSERGLFRCNESEVAPVSTPQTPDPLLPLIRQLTSAQFQKIISVYNRETREIWISIPGAGVYTYHTLLNAWSGPWDAGYLSPGATTALFEASDSNGLPIVLKGDDNGFVAVCDQPNTYLDNILYDGTGGTRYTMEAQFHRMYAGDAALSKALRWGYLQADTDGSDDSSVEWNTGAGVGSYALPETSSNVWDTALTWGVGSWGGPTSISYRIPMSGNGYYVDVTFADSGDALPVVTSFVLDAFALGRR